MPHLMNCSHTGEGWCLNCVNELHNEVEFLTNLVNQYPEYQEDNEYNPTNHVYCPVCGACGKRSKFQHTESCIRGKFEKGVKS